MHNYQAETLIQILAELEQAHACTLCVSVTAYWKMSWYVQIVWKWFFKKYIALLISWGDGVCGGDGRIVEKYRQSKTYNVLLHEHNVKR